MLQQNILLQTFIKFTINKLQTLKQISFKSYPKIVLTVNKNKVETLASFNPSTNEIICYTPKRLVADVFRSIAHEMVHFAQNMKQELVTNSGATGSIIENEANAIAGVILREFTEQYPEILTTSFEEIMEKPDSNIRNKYEKMLDRKYETDLDKFDANARNDRDMKAMINEYAQNILKKLSEKFKAENPNLTDDQFKYYIQRFEQLKSSPKVTEKDILKYSFAELEKLVDSFPTKMKSQPSSSTNNDVVFSDGELIYDKSPLQILHGDSPKQCIKIKGDFSASWCIARTSGNMYHNYRFGNAEPSFYFVKNLERLNKIGQLQDDPYCFFVVQINNQGKFIVTDALNDGDIEMTWQQVLDLEPLLQGTEKLFIQKALSDIDKADYKRYKAGISDESYKELSFDAKTKYISINYKLSDNQFENTPNEILNDYITMGKDLTDTQLEFIKNKKSLLDNYRRVTINTFVPEYLKNNVDMTNRWSVLSDNEVIDIYKQSRYKVDRILTYKPNLIDYFKDKLGDIYGKGIMDILKKQPTLINYFKDKLDQLSEDNITTILMKQPSLIKNFIDRLNELDKGDVRAILSTQPSLVTYFSNRIDEMEQADIKYLLIEQPSLIKYFDKVLSKLNNSRIHDILYKRPQLAKYFNKTKEDDLNELIKLGSELLNECDCDNIEDDEINELITHLKQETISEALYQGKSVTLNKPTRGDTKKFKVYVKNKSGKIVKVNFGSKDYNIKKNNPDRKKSYCARSKGIEGGGKDKTKANYWSRRAWKC